MYVRIYFAWLTVSAIHWYSSQRCICVIAHVTSHNSLVFPPTIHVHTLLFVVCCLYIYEIHKATPTWLYIVCSAPSASNTLKNNQLPTSLRRLSPIYTITTFPPVLKLHFCIVVVGWLFCCGVFPLLYWE